MILSGAGDEEGGVGGIGPVERIVTQLEKKFALEKNVTTSMYTICSQKIGLLHGEPH